MRPLKWPFQLQSGSLILPVEEQKHQWIKIQHSERSTYKTAAKIQDGLRRRFGDEREVGEKIAAPWMCLFCLAQLRLDFVNAPRIASKRRTGSTVGPKPELTGYLRYKRGPCSCVFPNPNDRSKGTEARVCHEQTPNFPPKKNAILGCRAIDPFRVFITSKWLTLRGLLELPASALR